MVTAIRTYHAHASHLDQVAAERAGIAATDLRCVNLLDLGGGRLSAGELAQACGLTTGAVTGVIDRLESAGLARRVTDPRDRRRVIVELDPNAHALGDALFEPLTTAEREHLERLSLPELEVLRDFLGAAAVRAQEQTARLRESRVVKPRGPR